jgi:chromatin segregation and condensation protein Rec8/ScpA/Scc1 (kleisin family)
MQSAFEKWKFQLFTKRKIIVQELAVDDIEKDILDFLEAHPKQISFSDYLAQIDEIKISQQYIVTCFVALLELVKYRQIDLVQKNEDIFFMRNKNKDEIQNSLIQREN